MPRRSSGSPGCSCERCAGHEVAYAPGVSSPEAFGIARTRRAGLAARLARALPRAHQRADRRAAAAGRGRRVCVLRRACAGRRPGRPAAARDHALPQAARGRLRARPGRVAARGADHRRPRARASLRVRRGAPRRARLRLIQPAPVRMRLIVATSSAVSTGSSSWSLAPWRRRSAAQAIRSRIETMPITRP